MAFEWVKNVGGVKHEYRPEGSDTGAKRMISLCSCGWRGPAVIEGQDFESRELAKRQWWNHVQEEKAK